MNLLKIKEYNKMINIFFGFPGDEKPSSLLRFYDQSVFFKKNTFIQSDLKNTIYI